MYLTLIIRFLTQPLRNFETDSNLKILALIFDITNIDINNPVNDVTLPNISFNHNNVGMNISNIDINIADASNNICNIRTNFRNSNLIKAKLIPYSSDAV